jgi:UPF0755 protein
MHKEKISRIFVNIGRWMKRHKITTFVVIFILFFVCLTFVFAPSDFPSGVTITIEEGMTINAVAEQFEADNLIKSPFWFSTLVRVFGGKNGVLAGDYFFESPVSVFGMSYRVSRGLFGIHPVRVTIPEGATIADIGEILKHKFVDFDEEGFLRRADGKEGYLFPDTYFFLPSVRPKEVIYVMEDNFEERMNEIASEIEEFGKSLDEVIIMASLLEKEARTSKSRRMISGILWERIRIGMALQVDAVFPYIIGKNTYQVTYADLKVDSPYNTYLYKGLPIGPIANPGLGSIRDAMNPTKSNYLFYLSDKRGNMYYAKTYSGHKRNIRLYMK